MTEGEHMRGAEASRLSDDFKRMGCRSWPRSVPPDDPPFVVTVKIGDHKWITFDDRDEIQEALHWLSKRIEEIGGLVEPEAVHPGGQFDEMDRVLQPWCDPKIGEHAAEFIWFVARMRHQKGRYSVDADGRTACHGCLAYHKNVASWSGVLLCSYCEKLTSPLLWTRRPWMNSGVNTVGGLHVGDTVAHKHFGEGIVLRLTPTSDDAEAEVLFQSESGNIIKKLLVSFARLQLVATARRDSHEDQEGMTTARTEEVR